jgi:hypothetical protein
VEVDSKLTLADEGAQGLGMSLEDIQSAVSELSPTKREARAGADVAKMATAEALRFAAVEE